MANKNSKSSERGSSPKYGDSMKVFCGCEGLLLKAAWVLLLFNFGLPAYAASSKLPPISVVSVGLGQFVLPFNATIALQSRKQYQPSDSPAQLVVYEQLKSEMRTAIERRGNRFVKREDADYLIAMTTVLGSAIDDDEIAGLFGLRTLLSSSKSRYSKGTVIIGILRPGEDHFQWRGVVQIQQNKKASDLANIEMTQLVIKRLVDKIPRGYEAISD